MKTLTEIALSTRFKKTDIPAILEIAGATPNPEMALNILMGLYKEPVLPKKIIYDGIERTAVRIDHWHNEVWYEYQKEKTKHIYVLKDVDESLITLDNYKEYDVNWEPGKTKGVTLNTGEFETAKSTMSIDQWLNRSMDAL